MSACSPSESQGARLAKAGTLSEVIEAVAYDAPVEAYTVSDTKYMAVIFERESINRDYPLMKAKELMPVLLERYPNVDSFFFAWQKDGVQFLKIQFDRADVQTVNWGVLMVKQGAVQRVSSMYWAVPELR